MGTKYPRIVVGGRGEGFWEGRREEEEEREGKGVGCGGERRDEEGVRRREEESRRGRVRKPINPAMFYHDYGLVGWGLWGKRGGLGVVVLFCFVFVFPREENKEQKETEKRFSEKYFLNLWVVMCFSYKYFF